MFKKIFTIAWLSLLCTCWQIAHAATTLNVAATPSAPIAPATVTLSVTVSNDTGPVTATQVEYFNGSTSLGVSLESPFLTQRHLPRQVAVRQQGTGSAI